MQLKGLSKFIILIVLILIFVRIAYPIRDFGRDLHYQIIDPLFANQGLKARYIQYVNDGYGKIAVDNLIHIAIIILLGIGLIFIIEGGRNKKDVPSEKTGEEKVSE